MAKRAAAKAGRAKTAATRKPAKRAARKPASTSKSRHYRLYGCHRCGSMMVEAALEEIGAPYDLVELEYNGPEHRSEQYRKLNPLARVPVLMLPDGTVVTESAAILLALAHRHPKAGLLPPEGSPEMASMLRWLLFLSNNVYEAVGRDDYPERYVASESARLEVRERAVADMKRFWMMVEQNLKPAPFALGKRFSALDLYIANLSEWIMRDWIHANCPRIKRLVARVAKRPRVQSVWRRHFIEKAPQ